ncbi:hypothetical protein GHT06_009747 [Daphnia sinensis]|uniref:Uncharacterized protein n=1 Tax=Daphnia sinensis TaxID=1820382 RepID=A0AAD5Q3F2_9CRUS|nr:hypothetical protein GHT06_009747 [Daphnia sinensis]
MVGEHLQKPSHSYNSLRTGNNTSVNMKLSVIIFSLAIATGLAAPLNVVYPHVQPFPSPFAHAVPVHIVHAVPAVETRIHYAETPVVVGHSTQILKPNLNPFVVAPLVAPSIAVAPSADPVVVEAKTNEEKSAEKIETPTDRATEEVKDVQVPLTYVAHPIAFAAPAPLAFPAPTVLDVKASVPAGDAPPMDQLVTKQKVVVPVRAISEVTPQVHVQHPTKINVEKVAVEVPVATPYALPVPVAVAPHYEIHHVHTPALTVVA